MLKDFKGYLQTDGWRAYDWADPNPNLIHCGCWDHSRRRFVAVAKAAGGQKRLKEGSYTLIALRDYIAKLYRFEREAAEQRMTLEQRHQMRQEKSRPLLEKFHAWLLETTGKVPPKSRLGDAINYINKTAEKA